MQAVAAPQTSTATAAATAADVDVCPVCQLFWFDAGELATLPAEPRIGAELARPAAIRCESCGAPARPDLDATCTYCGHRLAPATIPEIVGRPDGRDRDGNGEADGRGVGIAHLVTAHGVMAHGIGAVAAGLLRAWLD